MAIYAIVFCMSVCVSPNNFEPGGQYQLDEAAMLRSAKFH